MPIVTVQPLKIDKTVKALNRSARRISRKLAEHQADLLRQDSPIGDRDPEFDPPDVGPHLADTIKARSGKKNNVAEVVAAPHWVFALEGDTKPHKIRPKKPGGWLRFKGAGGGAVFRKEVNHPGTKGPRLVSKTTKMTTDAAQEIVKTELRIFVNEARG